MDLRDRMKPTHGRWHDQAEPQGFNTRARWIMKNCAKEKEVGGIPWGYFDVFPTAEEMVVTIDAKREPVA